MKSAFRISIALFCLHGGTTVLSQDMEKVVPPRPIYKVAPQHPEELYQQAVEGNAVIKVTIDIFGSSLDPEVVSATHEEFGLAALLAASEWIFEPATKNGAPIEIQANLPFNFTLGFEHKLNVELGREVFKKLDNRVLKASDLETSPTPRYVPDFSDFFPEELIGSGKTLSISVEFIIAPDGYIHNPMVKSASMEGYDKAILAAISRIQFNPIQVDGKPVFVSIDYPVQMSEAK